jgi:hypothetical protein
MRIDAKIIKEIKNQVIKQEIADYSARIGLLNFLAIICRPDISYAISTLSQFMQNSNESYWETLQRVFFYLKRTPIKGLTYKKSAENLIGYIDADWAEDRDIRKSTNNYIFLMQGVPINWRSKR